MSRPQNDDARIAAALSNASRAVGEALDIARRSKEPRARDAVRELRRLLAGLAGVSPLASRYADPSDRDSETEDARADRIRAERAKRALPTPTPLVGD